MGLFILVLGLSGTSLSALAHQPREVTSENIVVFKPEISKAYYGTLSGQSHFYTINKISSFDLYVNILVPFIEGAGKNIVVEIFRDNRSLGILRPGEKDWKEFFEPFGHSTYWQGPEFKIRAEAGRYKILVQSKEANTRYVLAIGEIESFDWKEGLNAILLIPELKRNFFEEPPISFIWSPLGWGYVLFLQLLALLAGWVVSRVLKTGGIKFHSKSFQKDTRTTMVWSAVLWIGMLSWAVGTSWHPVLILISGFALFVAIISWRKLRYVNRIEHN